MLSGSGRHADVYTDGACAGNGQTGARGGVGVYWGEGHPTNVAEPLQGQQTNNRAELEGIRTALNQDIMLSGSGRHADVYTDGACAGNGQTGARGGVGVYWCEGHPNNVAEPLQGQQTNNRAELEGIRTALNQAHNSGHTSVKIHTDSSYAEKGINDYSNRWEQNGWRKADGGTPANLDQFQEIRDLRGSLHSQGVRTEIQHVPGHSQIHGNEMADRLSREGAAKHGQYGDRY